MRLTVTVKPAGIRYYRNLPEPLTTPLPEIAKYLSSLRSGQTEDGRSVSATVGALRANDSLQREDAKPQIRRVLDAAAGLPVRRHGSRAGFHLLGGSADTTVGVPPCTEHECAPGLVVEVRCRKVVDPVTCPQDGSVHPSPAMTPPGDAGRGASSM